MDHNQYDDVQASSTPYVRVTATMLLNYGPVVAMRSLLASIPPRDLPYAHRSPVRPRPAPARGSIRQRPHTTVPFCPARGAL